MLGDSDRSGLLKDAEGKDNTSHGKDETGVATAVKEETTSLGLADQVGQEK